MASRTLLLESYLFMIVLFRKQVAVALLVALTVGLLSVAHAQTEAKPQPPADPLTWNGTLKSEDITESSGLARSSIIPDAFWTMNDSGNGIDMFLFDNKGNSLARCDMKGAANIDWEAMSTWQSGDDHFIVVADTGDNLRRRSEYRLYFAKEPKVKPEKKKLYKKSAPAVGVKFRFESGAMNCEAMGIPPGSDEVFFVEKQFAETNMQHAPAIFRLSLPAKELSEKLSQKRKYRGGRLPDVLVASKVAEFPVYGITGMAFSPDGKRVVIRNYLEMCRCRCRSKAKRFVFRQTVRAFTLPANLPNSQFGRSTSTA